MAKLLSVTAKPKETFAAPPMPAGAQPPYKGRLMTVLVEIECGSGDISDVLRMLEDMGK